MITRQFSITFSTLNQFDLSPPFAVFLFATFSVVDLVWFYFVPYVIFTVWLSLVTYLQHSDPKGRYYDERKWSFTYTCLTPVDPHSCLTHLLAAATAP